MHQRDQILENNSKGYREGEVHLHQASSYTVERDMHALEEICNAVSLRKIDHVTYFENYKVVRPPPTTTLLYTPLPITFTPWLHQRQLKQVNPNNVQTYYASRPTDIFANVSSSLSYLVNHYESTISVRMMFMLV